MATKRRKQRLERRVIRAFDKGKDSKSLVFQDRLDGIKRREGNRANDNTKVQRAAEYVADTFRNVAGFPARSLSASANQSLPKRDVKIGEGSIQSPEQRLVENRNKTVYGPTGKPPVASPSQDETALEATNLSPKSVVYSGGGSNPKPRPDKPTPEIVDESFPTDTPVYTEKESTIEDLTGANARSSSSVFGGSPSGSVFGGNAPASAGGIQLNPDGSTALGGDFSYALTPEQRAEEEARKREQDYYKKEARQKVDREAIMQNALRQFQGEIDAVNSVYADKIGQAKLEGADRLGSDRAANFNAGAVNSTFGEASKERVLEFNRGREGAIQNEKLNLISQINSAARALGDKFYAEKKAAKEAGLESYMTSLLSSKEAKTAIAKEVATNILSANLTPANMTEKQLKEIAKNAGVSVELIKNSFTTVKTEMEVAQAEADRKAKIDGQFTLGNTRYDSFGNVIATEGSTVDDGIISPEAQNIVDLMNTQGGTVDDYVKGISGEAQALRNEVYQALSKQGGVTEKSTKLFQEAKTIIDDMIGQEDWKRFGYSAKLGGKLSVKYGDMEARADTINAILARDNLGLLKGAMSDKDLAFIQAMSAGVPKGVISEKYAKERMESIQKKLQEKINQYTPTGAQTLQADEIEYLRSKGYPEEEIQALSGGDQVSFNKVGSDTYNAESIANAIKQVESQGNYQARGGSGEIGAYQFMPNTWKQWAGEFLGNSNAPMTAQNQDYVAMAKISQLIEQGYSPAEIALIWNGGTPKIKRGVNKYGVAYDSGAYANKVLSQLYG
jgi:hypothetical protein